MESRLMKSLDNIIDDLSSIEAATLLTDDQKNSVVAAYSKLQIEGDHLAVVLSDDDQLLSVQKKSLESAQKLRALTIDLMSGIIHNL